MSKKINKKKELNAKEPHVTAAEEFFKALDQHKIEQAKLGSTYVSPGSGTCPSCGHCPTCGRKNSPSYPIAPWYCGDTFSGYNGTGNFYPGL